MQRVLVIKPPYGTTIRTLHNSSDLWLMYDSSQDGVLIEWLRDMVYETEEKIRVEARQKADTELAQANMVPPLPPVQVNVAQAAIEAVKALPTPGQHDWGGPYKLGQFCTKCGVKADGLEKTCKPQQT